MGIAANASIVTRGRAGQPVTEECEVYRECGTYVDAFDKQVIWIECTDTGPAGFARACAARSGTISSLQRDRDVVPEGVDDYVFEHC